MAQVGRYPICLDQWRNNSRKNEKTEPKQKLCSVVDVSRGESEVQCCKNSIAQEPGKLGPWITVIGTGQTRAGKSEHWYFRNQWTKWMGKGEFNSDDHYIYYWGQESLRRDGVALMVNKRIWNAVHRCILKKDRMISFVFTANHSLS